MLNYDNSTEAALHGIAQEVVTEKHARFENKSSGRMIYKQVEDQHIKAIFLPPKDVRMVIPTIGAVMLALYIASPKLTPSIFSKACAE